MTLSYPLQPRALCTVALADTQSSQDKKSSPTNDTSSEPHENEPDGSESFKASVAPLLEKVGLDYAVVKRNAPWVVGVPTVVVILMVILLHARRKKHKATAPKGQMQMPVRKHHPGAAPKKGKVKPVTTDKDRVLTFFFRLFKQQVGADPDAATELSLIESRPTCPNDTYEMKVRVDGDWAFRRMSIGLLGQGGGSRSKCFYVIYDSHMVLKIPAVKIPTFSVYRKQIKAEARIVEKLYPRECIVPKTSVILKAVHTLDGGENLSEDAQEDKYVHLLEVNPEYREYLKIGSTYAFFMDLAKHFFLSSILDEIHRGDKRSINEALQHQELLWDQQSFVCRYGEDVSTVCHELQDAYHRNEAKMRWLVDNAQIMEDIPTYQFKQWFLKHLAGEKVDAATEELPEDLILGVNQLLKEVLGENAKQVELYRASVRRYIKEMRFSQNRNQLENLSSHTLGLLAWIDEKDLTMRDLKPENLFVAGDPNAYPNFLKNTRKFSIGLIDVETAVIMGGGEADKIPQPQLAGTPLYATPAHLLSNFILGEIYPDVRTILHMQDWYATIAIIYKIITGKNMFSSTALMFPELVKRIKVLDPAGPDLEREVVAASRLFWASAVAEFKHALGFDAAIIERIQVVVPGSMAVEIIKALHAGCDRLSSELAMTVSQQSVFAGREKCQFLLDVPVEKVAAMKQKLLNEKPRGSQKKNQHDEAIAVLGRVEKLKKRLQRKLEATSVLEAGAAAIAADQLLEAMFHRVLKALYPAHWPTVAPALWQGGADGKDIQTYQATIC